jgi:lipopolysaccharide assembly outer membrane protein LptD (OstA)
MASAQGDRPTQPVSANRIVLRVDADQWKGVSFQADSAVVESGGMRLTGNVRISIGGTLMAADSAVLNSDRVTLEGHARLVPAPSR